MDFDLDPTSTIHSNEYTLASLSFHFGGNVVETRKEVQTLFQAISIIGNYFNIILTIFKVINSYYANKLLFSDIFETIFFVKENMNFNIKGNFHLNNNKNLNKNSDFLKYIEYNGLRKFNPKNLPIKPNFKTLEQINLNQISYDQKKKNNTLEIHESKITNDFLDNKKKKELSSDSSKDQGELSLGEVADIIIYYSFKKNKKEDNFLFYKNDINKFKSKTQENYLQFFLK
jgi:hypothetical protein